jgi:hypothetical protein
MTVSVSGRLPDGDGNGLSAIISDLVRDPKKLHVCICILDGKKVTTDADSGETVPTARIRRIEVLADEDDMKLAENLMRRSLDRRTGRESLPYDLEEEIRAAFPHAVEDYDESGEPGQTGPKPE